MATNPNQASSTGQQLSFDPVALLCPSSFFIPLLVLVWEAYLEAFELNLVGLFPSPNLDHASHTNTNTTTRNDDINNNNNNNRSSCF